MMDENERAELVSRMFALLTMKFENGAAEAVKGQGRGKDAQTIEQLANQLQAIGEEIAIVAGAAGALMEIFG